MSDAPGRQYELVSGNDAGCLSGTWRELREILDGCDLSVVQDICFSEAKFNTLLYRDYLRRYYSDRVVNGLDRVA